MKLPQPGKEFELAPVGNHRAVCFLFVDLGTQDHPQWGLQRKVTIGWQLVDQKMEDGQTNFSMWQRYTWSMSTLANLRRDLESWRGKAFTESDFGDNGFDIKNIIGKSCLLNVIHNAADNNKTYANVAGLSPIPAGMNPGENLLVGDTVYFSFAEPDAVAFDSLSDRMKETIMQSPEYRDWQTAVAGTTTTAAAPAKPSPVQTPLTTPVVNRDPNTPSIDDEAEIPF